MFVTIEDFVREWTKESAMTLAALNRLTDESLSQAVTSDRRTLGRIAWHLVVSMHYMTYCGLDYASPSDEKSTPSSAAFIAESYRNAANTLLDAVQSQWSDADLLTEHPDFGEGWTNSYALRFSIMHQAHHRGQMTVLMRQAGLGLPEIYGENYESWVERGLAPLP